MIKDFLDIYSNDNVCLHKIFTTNFSNFICPKCSSKRLFNKVKFRRSYCCPTCGYQIYPTAGTLFKKTTTPLSDWFFIIYLKCLKKNGISSKGIENELPACYKTSLRISHLVNKTVYKNITMSHLVKVPIEIDITYVNKNWPTKRPQGKEKHYVFGFYQRGYKDVKGVAIIKSIKNVKDITIADCISENVKSGSTIYVEEGLLPEFLKDFYDIHELKESDGHSKGDLHVNNVKNMWRDLKRQIKREHVHVSKEHLQGYCDEVSWRCNNNHLSTMEKFELIMSNIQLAPKLTYKNLISRTSKKFIKQ